MILSRIDIELLNASGWEVVVTNGHTTIKKPDGFLIDDPVEIINIIEEERFEQNNNATKLFSQYIIIVLFVFFLFFLLLSFF